MLGAIVVGFAAGVVAGMLGVGGGILFVPGLVLFLGPAQVDAEATSLLAIIPVALVGAARQNRYGNFRPRDALLLGCWRSRARSAAWRSSTRSRSGRPRSCSRC